MQRAAAYLISIVLLLTGYFYSNTLQYETTGEAEQLTRAIVLDTKEVTDTENGEYFPDERQWDVKLRITKGAYEGREFLTEHYAGLNPAFDFSVLPGDEVIVGLETEDFVLKEVYIAGPAREKYLYYLFAFFVLMILIIGAKQGLKTVLSLVVTGWAVLKILLPGILAGINPILITVVVCTGITIVTHMLISGFNKKSLAAITGTMIGVVLGGALANYVIALTRVNGLGTEEARLFFFSFAEGKLDFAGILFAGIVIGSLGAVMDVGMSIASSINEIYCVHPGLSFGQLVKSGLNIGRDIIGTMSNTLILAYTGGSISLMLLLLANDVPYLKYINLDAITAEIIRALTGSIGLFLAVPVTALVSAALCHLPKPGKRPER